MISEAKPGEFTLVYNGDGVAHPVALTKEQHQIIQALVHGLPGTVVVVGKLKVETSIIQNNNKS